MGSFRRLTSSRRAKSSDKAENLPLLGRFFKSSAFPIYFEILPLFLAMANRIHRRIEVLLFSTSFLISVLCGDVETENRLILCHRQINIAMFSEHKNLLHFFFQKGGRSANIS